jgi:hypothetical protein
MAMVVIALLYICLAWLEFFRFKLLPWNWPWRIVTTLVGVGILAVFMGLLNYLTPSGRIAVIGRVVAVTPLRNGRLNQMAYSLLLFIRDVADGELVGWIERQLQAANDSANPNRLADLREALVGPLREVYGVSDKVLTMTLSGILLAAPENMPIWIELGASMIAIDTLVHNFLHRTGILHRFDADHAYGMACYRPGGCASIIEVVAGQIDAREFNLAFPRSFPRFVQYAIWRYCSQNGLDVCNGNRIDDAKSCGNVYCQIYNI